MPRFYAPKQRPSDGRWWVEVRWRRENGQPAGMAQGFRTKAAAWNWIIQQCDQIRAEVSPA